MTASEQSQLNVFLSYSHKDEDLLNQLLPHLATLRRQEFINTWHDRQITGGTEWAKAIEDGLATADIILLLVSADFIASDYCWTIELKQAIQRHEAGTARVIPIILRPCDWTDTPFSKLQGFPKNANPVSSYAQQDDAFTEIAKGLRTVVDEIIAQKQPTVGTTPSAPQLTLQAQEPTIGLWVHGWEKQSFEHPSNQTIIQLPWQDHFNRKARQVPDLQSWLNILEPQLEQTKANLLQDHTTKYLDIRGKLPLSYSLAIGATFPRVGGFQLRTQQDFPDQASQLWHSHAERSGLKFKTVAEDGLKGEHLLIAFGISGSLENAVKNWQMSDPVAFSAEVYLEPTTGANRSSLQSEGDAIALAIAASETITQLKEKYAATHTHIILRAPAGFALFLGQQLNAVGTVTVYEWTSARGYTPAVQLQTG